MQAEIKNFHCPNIECLKTYKPDISNNFSFYLELSIGPKDECREEKFATTICTPNSFYDDFSETDIVFPLNRIIVFNYDYNLIFKEISHFVETREGDDWEAITQKLCKVMSWEFETYHL